MSVTVIAILVILVIMVLIGVGFVLKARRTDEDQVNEDNDQAAFLAAIDKPHNSVHEYTSPVTGLYVRKPVGSRKIQSSTPGLAGAGPLVNRNYDDAGLTIFEPVDLKEFDQKG